MRTRTGKKKNSERKIIKQTTESGSLAKKKMKWKEKKRREYCETKEKKCKHH